MLLRESPPDRLWDTWLLYAQGAFHLFYLILGNPRRIGHA